MKINCSPPAPLRRTLKALLAVCATCVIGACASTGSMSQGAVPDMTNAADSAAKDVTTYGMGVAQQRFSTMTQINKSTVKDLVPVWNLSLNNSSNMESQPLVINGVMYVVTHDSTAAIDALTGRQIWKTQIELPSDVAAMVCCGIQARGLAYKDGVIYRATLDAHLQAMSAVDGKILWRTRVADYKKGYSITGAPLLVNGVLMTGMAGGEYNTRGFINGYEPATGKLLWTRYTTAGPGDPNNSTWNGNPDWATGGGTTWITGSYDPKLDLVYWGTGNGSPWNPQMRSNGGDSLYICSVLAIRPKTGEIVWHYQFSPADPYDYDAVNEMVLADVKVKGQAVSALINANRNGFFYVLDRATGKLLAANQYAKKVNWAEGIDLTTGRPIDSDMTKRFKNQETMSAEEIVYPTIIGAKNWQPISFDPTRQLAFVNGMSFGAKIKNVHQELRLPAMFFGMDIQGYITPEDGNRGYFAAVDPTTGKHVWEVPLKIPNWSGVMSTAGGIVFTANLLGEFLAYDSDTGRELWKFQTGSGISGMPITWEMNGKQYVTVTSGAATLYNATGGDKNLPAVPVGGSVWTFALH
ncbi:MAG: putative quinoprotein ethanol dehydrogenase precursor [Rhizobacter sp.]|nr:putative quinoprotein ethanol dehydrogenase precursor [Rhizobacter sp.]